MTRRLDADEIARRVAAETDRSVAALRRVRRAVSRELRAQSGGDVLRVVESLLAMRAECPRWLAWEIVSQHAAAIRHLTPASVNRLGAGLDGWGEVDAFAVYVLGPGYREGSVGFRAIERWARSKDRWRRRAAVACTVALNNSARGGTGDAEKTLAVCELVIGDRDALVTKALSWALRELAVKRPREAERFLAQRRAVLAARVVREVENKLATGLKQGR